MAHTSESAADMHQEVERISNRVEELANWARDLEKRHEDAAIISSAQWQGTLGETGDISRRVAHVNASIPRAELEADVDDLQGNVEEHGAQIQATNARVQALDETLCEQNDRITAQEIKVYEIEQRMWERLARMESDMNRIQGEVRITDGKGLGTIERRVSRSSQSVGGSSLEFFEYELD